MSAPPLDANRDARDGVLGQVVTKTLRLKSTYLRIVYKLFKRLAAHTGLEPVISALRGQRVNRLHQCAAEVWDYR